MEKRAIEIFAYFFLGYFTDTNGRTKPEWKHQRPHQRKTCSHVRTKNQALEITAAYKCLVSLLAVWHWPSNSRKKTRRRAEHSINIIYIYILQWCRPSWISFIMCSDVQFLSGANFTSSTVYGSYVFPCVSVESERHSSCPSQSLLHWSLQHLQKWLPCNIRF